MRAPHATVTIGCLSDTHMRHERIAPVAVDLLIHAGDWSRRGTLAEARAFFAWLATWPAAHKVAIAGNHDVIAEHDPGAVRALAEAAGAVYLCDEPHRALGLNLWGSPWTPRFHNMAFNLERGEALAARWRRIPAELDVLITHGPPQGIGDRTALGVRAGCADLSRAVARSAPRVHVFGHIHEAAGAWEPSANYRVQSYNVSSGRLLPFGPLRAPVTFDLAPRG